MGQKLRHEPTANLQKHSQQGTAETLRTAPEPPLPANGRLPSPPSADDGAPGERPNRRAPTLASATSQRFLAFQLLADAVLLDQLSHPDDG